MNYIILSLVGLLLIPALYLYTVSIVTRLPTLSNKHICLLIAHPDDEAMFFAPSVLGLTRPESGNHVMIMCLSSGNAEGLGEIRKKEMVKSGLVLGLTRGEEVMVVDNPVYALLLYPYASLRRASLHVVANRDFPDCIRTPWSTAKISSLLREAFIPNFSSSTPSSEPPKSTIDVLITLDSRGVSSHPNHISLYYGARAFASSLTRNKPSLESPVDLYTLTSVDSTRKYTGMFDVFATLVATILVVWRGGTGGKRRRKVDSKCDSSRK